MGLLLVNKLNLTIRNYGDITIHTQGERTATMKMIKDLNKVASQIRDNMGRPIARI